MGITLELAASDGHHLGAYRADPAGPPRGAVVVIQEIFGVNAHIRDVCDRLASAGYVAAAPALFDRKEKDFQTGFSPEEVARARAFLADFDMDKALLDVEATRKALAGLGAVAVVGFCLGGSVAYAAATRLPGLARAVGYYGGMIAKLADEKPQCPTLLHFGEQDASIPLADVETVRARRPEVEIHLYPAGHAFNNDQRASYEPQSAALAWERTLHFLEG